MVTEMTVQLMRQRLPALAMLAVFVFSAVQTAQANEAGKVIFAKGPVSAEREPPVPLSKGDAVLAADTVVTGEAARAQLLMLDGAKVAIRPNSRLLIEEFLFPSGEVAEEGKPVATVSGDRAVYRLIKGGFRSITGAIGKNEKDEYEVRTPVGTLGIRGTDYSVLLCQSDCESTTDAGGSSLQDGLHVSVASGVVVFSNEFGAIDITAGNTIVIPLADRRPQRVGAPQGGGDEDSGDDPTDEEAPETPDVITDPNGNEINITDPNAPPADRTISWSTAPLTNLLAGAFSGTQDNTATEYFLDGADNLEGFDGPYPTGFFPPPRGTPPVRGTFQIGTATNTDTGFDSVTMLRWGRWSGGTATITLEDGSDASQDLTAQSLHWVSGPEWLTPPVLPISGSVDYTLVGNTSPTDNNGNVGVLGSATFSADFTNMQVFNSLFLTINGSTWDASGVGDIGARVGLPAHQFMGSYGSITITDPIGASTSSTEGYFSGFFSDPGNSPDPAVPGGVGLTYALTDENGGDGGVVVSGALAFGDPVPAGSGL